MNVEASESRVQIHFARERIGVVARKSRCERSSVELDRARVGESGGGFAVREVGGVSNRVIRVRRPWAAGFDDRLCAAGFDAHVEVPVTRRVVVSARVCERFPPGGLVASTGRPEENPSASAVALEGLAGAQLVGEGDRRGLAVEREIPAAGLEFLGDVVGAEVDRPQEDFALGSQSSRHFAEAHRLVCGSRTRADPSARNRHGDGLPVDEEPGGLGGGLRRRLEQNADRSLHVDEALSAEGVQAFGEGAGKTALGDGARPDGDGRPHPLGGEGSGSSVVEVAEELRKADRYRFPFGYGGVSGAPGEAEGGDIVVSQRRGDWIPVCIRSGELDISD